MSDVNANIDININSSNALAQLKSLQRQIAQFHTSIAKSSESAALAQRGLQKNLLNSINAINGLTAEMRTVTTSAESFTNSLEKNKFSMREYFRYAGASTKTFGRLFKSEFDTIGKVAEERVKRLQTQYIKMGRDANGAMQAISITPTSLNMQDYGTKTAIAAQKQALFNQLMKQGSTNLLNFGKNTQWAGRQLMVGFTIPLAMVGTAATKTFMEMEAQAIKFKKVYGDLFTPKEETQQALDNITELGKSFTQYGIAVSTTVGLAAEAAAAGFSGLDLQRQTTEATRLSILGQIDSQKALETTISLQNAFGMSSEKLAGSIDFLNAVENQTVVSLDDITTAIPKVAPVIQQLGGDVKDLTFFMAAMKEGGINASEGANALKSGLAALINPTGRANEMLKGFGINANEIVTKNKGDLKATVIEFAEALNALDPLNRAQAIEQMFGKFQFARLSTLFANVAKDGNQAARVLNLANSSVEELSSLSEQELGMTADSAMNKFKKTVEDLKIALVPVGKAFLEAVTPIVEFAGNILEKFGNLSDGTKKVITLLTVGIGAVGPVLLMTFGLLANGVANIIKLFLTLRNGYQRLTGQSQILGEQTQYMTMEQLDAAAAAHSLNQTHATLTQTFTAEHAAIQKLIAAYSSAASASANFARANPGMMMPGRGVTKLASGIVSVPGPKGAGDIVPAMLSPGEAVVPADMAKKYAPLIQAMIAGNIPGFAKGRTGKSGTNVKIPGGFAAAHFGGSNEMSGTDLLAQIEGRSDKMAESLREMVRGLADADQKLTVFTNEVVATSLDLNEAFGKTGSGKEVSTEFARNEMLDPAYAKVRDIELQRQLEAAGMPIEEIRAVNEAITKEIAIGFETLKDKTVITAEHLDKVISEAYQAVAKTDKKIEAAYARMKEVTTLTDPNLLTRRPVTDESYKTFRKNNKKTNTSPYYDGMERMAGKGNVPYSAEASFRINNSMADQLGMSSKNASIIYEQFSKEVKIKLSTLRGDITKFTSEFQKQAELAGLRTGESYQVGLDKSKLEDPYVKSRDRQSPHPLAAKDGTEDGKAYDAARSAVIEKTSGRGRRAVSKPAGSPLQSGIAISDPALLSMAYQENMMRDKVKEQASKMQVMNQKMDTFNKGLMGGTFALTSLAGAGSMAGGTIGNLSQQVMKYSGLLFGLMSVTQLLTQTKIAELAATRIGLAKSAGANALAAGPMFGGLSKAISGRAGLIGIISRVGIRLAAFLGPVGMAIAAIGTVYGAFKFFKKRSDDAAFAAEGLAKAMTLSKDKVKTLAELLGQTPTPRAGSGARVSANQLDAAEQTSVDELKNNEEFLNKYKKDIEAIKQATVGEAQIAFNAIALDLSGQGFTDKAIKTYIDALGEKSSKTEVALKFKKIDLSKEEGVAAAVQLAKDTEIGFNKAFEGGIKTKKPVIAVEFGKAVYGPEEIKLTAEQQQKLNIRSAALANTITSLTAAFGNQTIKADAYNAAMLEITKTIPKGNVGLLLMDQIMTNINPEFAKSANKIKDYDTRMLLLRASLVNASVAQSIFTNLMSTDQKVVAKAREELEKYRIATDALAGQVVTPNAYVPPDSTSKEKSPFQLAIEQLKQQRKEMVDTVKAYTTLKNAGVAAGKAFAIAKDPILAAGINSTKVGTAKWKELIKLIKETDAALVKSKLTELRADRDYTKQFTAVVPVLKNLGLNAQEIQDIFADPAFAQQFIKNIKNGKLATKDLNDIVTVTMQDRTAKLNFETSLETEEEKFKSIIGRTSALISLREKLIDLDYASKLKTENDELTKQENALQDVNDKIDAITKAQIDPLNARINANNFALEKISRQEDIINEKYETQTKALEKIKTLNQDISNVQKQRLGIADALSSGNISQAVQLIQDARAQQAESAVSRQQDGLTASRDAALEALGRNKLEKENKDLQFQISVIENEKLLTLKNQKSTIEDQINATQRAITKIELQVKTLKNTALYAGQTKTAIDEQEELINLADAAGIKYNATLIKQLANAQGIEAAIKELDTEVTTIHTIITKNVSGGGGGDEEKTTPKTDTKPDPKPAAKPVAPAKPTTPVKPPTTLREAERSTPLSSLAKQEQAMANRNPLYRALGGLVPKYFALGGFARGTDKVPAMLTPGEFIVNRAAASANGPMLKSLNESKYPSMLGTNSSPAMPVVNSATSLSDNSTAVYNYTLGFNINGSTSNPNDIARAVIKEIKQIDSQRIRGSRR
jgi:TP901 family phage tail tape measure protein